MENICVAEYLTDALQLKQEECKEVTDLELICQIITVFHEFPEKRYMTVQEIFASLSECIKTEKYKVATILEIMCGAPICSKMISKTGKGEIFEVQYRWAIRSGGPGTDHESVWISG